MRSFRFAAALVLAAHATTTAQSDIITRDDAFHAPSHFRPRYLQGTSVLAKASTNRTDDEHPDDEHHSHETGFEIILLTPFLLLITGVVVKVLLANVPLPFTAILLMLGLFLGMGLRKYDTGDWDDSLAKSSNIISGFDPHLLLFTFLPPLLFESASQMEWHLCWSAKSYILSLAGPGVLIATFMTGFFLNQIIPNIGSSGECWRDIDGYLLGVILSATDPVAVVALLAELGAKKSLATNIEGESLLNDGSAYVIFLILLKIAEGDNSDEVQDYFWVFFKMAFGGVAWGYMCGVLMMLALSFIINDSIAEITVTVCFAWLTFFIAEYYMGISGVLAVVALGLHFGYIGRISVSAHVWHTMEEFWEMMVFFANTLVFTVAGMIIGHRSVVPTGTDFIHLFLSYFVITFVRSIVVFCVYTILNMTGKSLDWRDQVVGVWGGLRGAVGLALAMIVLHSVPIHDQCSNTPDKIMYHTAGIVLLTVCFNAPTLPLLMKKLKMTEISKAKRIVYKHSIDTVVAVGDQKQDELSSDPKFDHVDWDAVRKFYVSNEDSNADMRTTESQIALDEEGWTDNEARMRVLMVCKECYMRSNREGQLSRSATLKLKHISDVMLDEDHCPLEEWSMVQKWLGEVPDADKAGKHIEVVLVKGDEGYNQQEVLKVMDDWKFLVAILTVVVLACVSGFAYPEEKSLDFIFATIFILEVSIRCWAIGNWTDVMADPFTTVDILLTAMDVIFIALSESVGDNANTTVRTLRVFRFLRLARIFRMARLGKVVANKMEAKKQEILADKEILFSDSKAYSSWLDWFEDIPTMFKKWLVVRQVEKEYQTVLGFLHAREEAHHLLGEMLNEMTMSGQQSEVMEQIHKDMMEAKKVLRGYQATHSEVAARVTSMMAAHIVLNGQMTVIDELGHHGMIVGSEWERMLAAAKVKLADLQYRPPRVKKVNMEEMKTSLQVMTNLTNDLKEWLLSIMVCEIATESKILQSDKEPPVPYLYFVGRGIITISRSKGGWEEELAEVSNGELIPSVAMLNGKIADCSVKSTGPSLMFRVPMDEMLAKMKESEFFKLHMVEQVALATARYRYKMHESDNNRDTIPKEIRSQIKKLRLFKNDEDKLVVKMMTRDDRLFFLGYGSITNKAGKTFTQAGFIEFGEEDEEFTLTAGTLFLCKTDLVRNMKPWVGSTVINFSKRKAVFTPHALAVSARGTPRMLISMNEEDTANEDYGL